MNNKGIKQLRVYIVLVIVFIAALIGMFYLIENTKQKDQAKPLTTTSSISSPSTTTISTTNNIKNEEPKEEKLVSSPFEASLSDIIYGRIFEGKFSETIIYNNAKFSINCNTYDEATSLCSEGSGLMDYNGALIPIFTFSGSDNNYLNFARDVYIIIKDNYIFVTMNHVGSSAGKTLVFKTDGTMIGEIPNTLTGYVLNGRKIGELYPNFTDNKFNFYYLDNGIIKIGYVDINDVKRTVELETVSGATISS